MRVRAFHYLFSYCDWSIQTMRTNDFEPCSQDEKVNHLIFALWKFFIHVLGGFIHRKELLFVRAKSIRQCENARSALIASCNFDKILDSRYVWRPISLGRIYMAEFNFLASYKTNRFIIPVDVPVYMPVDISCGLSRRIYVREYVLHGHYWVVLKFFTESYSANSRKVLIRLVNATRHELLLSHQLLLSCSWNATVRLFNQQCHTELDLQ